MKKYISVLIVLLLLSGITSGCQTADSAKSDKISVVTTIFPQYDFARQIAGNNIDLIMLLSPGMESHSYEPTPKDIKTISSCDIFIYVGGEGEKWVDDILSSIDTSNIKLIALTECVELVEEEIVEGMQNDEDDEQESSHEKEYDEHVWTSPKNAALIVEEISAALCSADPEKASYYENNKESYLKQLSALDSKLTEIVAEAKRDTLVFGDRFPFRYLTEAYGLRYFAAFPGCASDTEPSAATIAFLINKIKTEVIPCVLYIELSNENVADTLCESTGAKKLPLHSCHNLTKADFEAGVTYIELMNRNADVLKEALS